MSDACFRSFSHPETTFSYIYILDIKPSVKPIYFCIRVVQQKKEDCIQVSKQVYLQTLEISYQLGFLWKLKTIICPSPNRFS